MSLLRVTWAVLEKDLRAELRSREAMVTMGVFALLTVVVFNFAFQAARPETVDIAPGVLWMAFLFSSMLGLNRSFAVEREAGAINALLLAPADRGAIYLGKMFANCLFLVALQVLVLPIFALLYNLDLGPTLGRLAPIFLLGALALAACGTMFAALSANTRLREVMTPLLMFPAAAPVLIAAVEGTGIALRGEVEGYSAAVRLLGLFAVVFTTLSYLLFEYVLEE